ncbi:MAG: quinoprotein relay system zinc metallohydrolase 1 [Rhodocyclaceae bacterium]|nr:quinoprotein relay system zinc metallohydrolase 1 [Rhodocyclaceae bacterium]
MLKIAGRSACQAAVRLLGACACGVLAGVALSLAATVPATAAELDIREVAPGTWALIGQTEDLSPQNAGNIANAGFIATPEGVVVIDTSASKALGEAWRAAIAARSPAPIVHVFNTHLHPDHMLGNQAFPAEVLATLPATRQAMHDVGEAFNDNLYRMVGAAMKGTHVVVPATVAQAGVLELGGNRIRVIALQGHSAADLAVFDETTGVLFTGDLVFWQRAPTTPHADLVRWRESLAALAALLFRHMVPGHGPLLEDRRGIDMTRRWLDWLEATFVRAAEAGLDMNDVLALPLPDEWAGLPLAVSEYRRSVAHLYPAIERRVLGGTP